MPRTSTQQRDRQSVSSTAGTRGAISVRHVSKAYEPGRSAVVAVEDCSLEIEAGEFQVLVGPSGCGKTTLLNAIAGFHPITSGEIRLDGELLCGPGQPQATPGSDRVVVFQNGALFPWKTVLDNITYGPTVQHTMTSRDARERARERMAQVGLDGLEGSYPGELSSGMARRVEIVRALMNEPKVLLLDEPFRGMDALTKSVMHEYLLELYDSERVTVLFITHDLEEAVFLGGKVAVMTTRPGRIKQTFDIDLARPRDYHVLTSVEFRSLMERIVATVHEEARNAFEAGEREMV